MEIREIERSRINPAPYNPRVKQEPGMPEYEKLRRNIERYGLVEPLVWNERTGNLVGGHQRFYVCCDLGWKKIPCSVVDLDEAEEKLLNVILNKVKGRWDYDKLEELLRGFDYEVAALTGFAEEEIAVILANNRDLQDGDMDWSDWDEPDEEQVVGGSYVLTLVFANAELAREWAENEGHEGQVKDGSSTTVIRIEE